ncbi:HlyD family efflux transporter periplasmic adaptor subunit [Verrucomicrobia bacterium]|nr:HlyD family efflux transporter periplasmic adaptor subunit [Verrucomicrobiota bacterium]
MSQPNKSTTSSKRMVLIGGSIAVFVIILLIALSPSDDSTEGNTEFHEVSKGEFLVTVMEGGNLESVNEVSVRNDMKYTSKIVSIVAEGTFVKKGDQLCELDVSEIEDRLDQQKLSVESAEFDLTQSKENLKIQKSIIDSNIKASALKVEFAKIDLEKYILGDMPQARRDATNSIITATEKFEYDQDNLKTLEELFRKGFESRSKVEQSRLTFLNSEVKLDQAKEAKRLLEDYDFPKKTRQFESDRNEAEEDLVRVKAQSESKLAQYNSTLRSSETKLELNKKKLDEYISEIAAAKVYAPEDGMVVYPFVSYRSSSQTMIEEGATVRPQQTIIKLPDTSKMKLSIKVHESHINQIREGLPAYVVLDPFPDKQFAAVVTKVALLPDAGSRYSNPNLKVYSTEVLITDQLPDVKPGVSGRAEIIITKLEEVITVPIQSVTTHKGKQVVYIKDGGSVKPVTVQVGLFNNKYIEVREGLNPGDLVSKAPPLDFEGEEIDDSVIKDKDNLPESTPVNERPEDKPKRKAPQTSKQGGQGRAGGASSAEAMKRFDKDGDGKLNEEERNAMRKSFGSREGKGGSEAGRGQGGTGRGPAGGGRGPTGGGKPGASIESKADKQIAKEFAAKQGGESSTKNFEKQARKDEKTLFNEGMKSLTSDKKSGSKKKRKS